MEENKSVLYKPFSVIGNESHPGVVEESDTLSYVKFPTLNYQPYIPLSWISNSETNICNISRIQFDAVVLSGSAHSKLINSETRQGFILADGAGVGKGRQIAGMILDNFGKGRCKSIWFSVSNDLKKDAERDMQAVLEGTNIKIPIFGLPNTLNQSITEREGTLFVTYTAISRNETRFKQIKQWLQPLADFEGIIIFDEAHKAKGYNETELSTETGKTINELQNLIPKCRIVYATATLASNTAEMQYMQRCDLWGESSFFKNANMFIAAMEERGISGCELLAVELKQRGIMISRHLTFEGVTVSTVNIEEDSDFERFYEDCCSLWMLMYRISKHKQDKKKQSTFWAANQRFFKSLCVSSKVPTIIRIVKEALLNKKSVIIGVQSTGDATYKKFRESKFYSSEELCSNTGMIVSHILIDFLKMDPVALGLRIEEKCSSSKRQKLNENDSESDSSVDSSGESDDDEFGLETDYYDKDALHIDETTPNYLSYSKLKKLEVMEKAVELLFKKLKDKFPPNPIDQIYAVLGGAMNVSELTGRKRSQDIITSQKGDSSFIDAPKTITNIKEQQRFSDQYTTVAIISEAASTGISLHSSNTFKNQRQRLHILLELPWSANSVIQQMGRTNRTNQVSPPEYILPMSFIPAEVRFACAVGTRMKKMGAITKGDYKTSQTRAWDDFEIRPQLSRKAVEAVLNAVLGKKSILHSLDNNTEKKKLLLDLFRSLGVIKSNDKVNYRTVSLGKFLNRVIGLPVQFQRTVISLVSEATLHLVETSEEDGEFDSGIIGLQYVMPGEISIIEKQDYSLPGGKSTSFYNMKASSGTEWDQVKNLDLKYFKREKKDKNGFNAVIGIKQSSISSKSIRTETIIYKPNSTKMSSRISIQEYLKKKKYSSVSGSEGEKLWKFQRQFMKKGACKHQFMFGKCENQFCRHKKTEVHFGIIVENCLSLWDFVATKFENSHFKIIKWKNATNDISLVGIYVPPNLCIEVKSILGSLSQLKTWRNRSE